MTTPAAPRVLLVEDNAVNRYLAQFLLERGGFIVGVAENGALALDAVHAERPDLILMDIRMPVMDGYEATERLKADTDPLIAAIPVVALSAHAMPQEKARALAAGCIAHIEKPIDTARFVDQVKAFLPTAVNPPAPTPPA